MPIHTKAKELFNEIFEDGDITEQMERAGVIEQELGFRLTATAYIELALEDVAGWKSVAEDGLPTIEDGRVEAFTNNVDEQLRNRFIPAGMFKQVASEATHWRKISTPITE